MPENGDKISVKGERSLSQGFIAQYSAEAAMQVPGVAGLETGVIVSLKEVLGGEHNGKGVRVLFQGENADFVQIDVFPLMFYGYRLPDVAWQVQEQVKEEVERFTGLPVNEVNVQVMGIVREEEEK